MAEGRVADHAGLPQDTNGRRAARYPASHRSGTVTPMTGLGILIVLVAAILIAVALLPMIVLLDLAGGGTGLGICEGGLGSCRTSYFDGPELAGMLVLVILLLVLVLRALLRVRDAVEHHQNDSEGPTPRRPGR
jgi:hypothetical protein